MAKEEPILRTREIAWKGRQYNLSVFGGLRMIKGNKSPYFVLQCWYKRGDNDEGGGANHELILRYYPELADLAALHLSSIDGEPMHAEANGWYHLAGDLPGNAGEPYHVGNCKQNFPKPSIDPVKPWETTDYRMPTPNECLQIFAEYMRVPLDAAKQLRDFIATEGNRRSLSDPAAWRNLRDNEFRNWVNTQRPRWKAEAVACIAKHGLIVFGDEWKPLSQNALRGVCLADRVTFT